MTRKQIQDRFPGRKIRIKKVDFFGDYAYQLSVEYSPGKWTSPGGNILTKADLATGKVQEVFDELIKLNDEHPTYKDKILLTGV